MAPTKTGMNVQCWRILGLLVMVLVIGRDGQAVEKASEQVSPFYGSVSYSVPIEVPSFRGLEPKLSFAYSSEGRNGFLGVGWNVSGISTIQRVNAGLGTPRFDAADVYLLDGQQLVPCGAILSPSCTSGGSHATKDESYLKILFNSGANTWTVWGRDGTRTVFSPTLVVGQGHTLRWGQTSTIDTKGNTVSTAWTCLSNDCYPEAIAYNGYSITFVRESRTDVLSFAAMDVVGKTLYRLRSVFVSLGSTAIRAYRANYSTSPLTGRSLLTSIEQFGKDVQNPGAVPLPAQTFTYQDDLLGKGFYPISGDPPTPPGTLENVVWANLVNTQATGNNLIKSGGSSSAWDAGASSTRAIVAGDGYLEITTSIGGNKMIGLSNGDGDASNTDIDFALYENATQLYVSESGVLSGPLGHDLVNGEPLRVEVQNGHIYYKQNGVVVRDVQKRLTYPLLADASIYSNGQWINGAVLYGSLQNVTHWCGEVLLTADVNGDGRTDQVCHRGLAGTTQVALATPTGFAAPTLWLTATFAEFTMGDFNSDGKADLAIYDTYSGNFSVALSTGTAFATPVWWGNASGVYQGYPYACRRSEQFPYVVIGTGDFNGDGITDVSCKVAGQPEEFIGLTNATSAAFSFSIFGQLSCDIYERTGAIDFDGDGKDDWYCIGSQYGNLNVFPSTGSSFLYPAFGSLDNNFCDEPHYVLGDFNGDGRTDAGCTSTGHVALSTGNHFVVQPESPPFGAWCYASGAVAFAADVDGDGASEIVCNYHGAPANDIEVRKWKGEAWAPVEIWKASWCAATVQGGDFNGDGKTDLLCSALSSPVVAGTGGLQSDLLAVAGNGLGGTLQTSYSTSANYPNTNNPPPKQVVTMVTTNDGRGGSSSTTYSYSGGLMDRQERRFLGFHEVTEALPCINGDCPSVVTTLKQDLPSAGKPEKIERRDGGGHLLQKQEYVYATTTAPPRTSLLIDESSYTYDLAGAYKRTRATHQYDTYGNRTQTAFYGDVDVEDDDTTTTWTFRPNTSAYIVERVALQQQFAGIGPGGNKLAENRYSYDNAGTWDTFPTQGYLTRVERWLDTEARYVARTMGYDSWGNLNSVVDETSRPTTTIYDPTYHVFPTSVTNGAIETETATWDAVCGVPLERRDANNQPTTFQSDNFCRPYVTNSPLGGFEIRTYESLGNPATQHVRVETPSATPEDGTGNDYAKEYFDGLGRPYKTIKKGPTPAQQILRDTTYNARGQTASETAPYYMNQTAYTTSYTYDSLDRLLSARFPDNNQIQKTYGIWRGTTIDEHPHSTTVRFDAYGRTATREQQLNGQTLVTSYSYDLLGRMTGITDPVGITWSWTFDSLGRNTIKADPDSGSWSFDYDDAGRVLQQTDAKSQPTDFTYDGAGRLATKTTPVEAVTIGYSEPRSGFFNAGRMTSVSVPGRTLTMDYDAAAQPVKQVRTLDGGSYVAERRYDSAGRLRGITYPDGDTMGTPANPLGYDAAGRLLSIPNIVSQVLYDAAGRPTSQTNLNGTTTTKTYTNRGFLTGISTGGGAIQNLVYTPDPAGLVDNVWSSFMNESWDYTYDELHRMTSAQSLCCPIQNQTFQYDSIGRITNNSKIGPYTYPPVGSPRPHAPATVNGGPYSYDLNGNLFSGGTRTIQWNPDNLPTQITMGSTTTTFTYDGLGERVKKVSGTSTSRYPLGDDYEVTNGTITKYLNVDGLGVIAKRVGSQTTYWLHTDRLGSIQAVTDATGAVVQRRTYRPYGDKIADTTSHVESRGYIDQRQDGETSLTYLHARYYDPALGIFLSPDPIGPEGGLNSYAYSYGDPINATDPSGLCPGCQVPEFPSEVNCSEQPWLCPPELPTPILVPPGTTVTICIDGICDGNSEEEGSRFRDRQARLAEREALRLARLAERGQSGGVTTVPPPSTPTPPPPPNKPKNKGTESNVKPAPSRLSRAIDTVFPNRTCSGGYSDLNAALGGKGLVGTGGAMVVPGGGVYPYLGGGIGTPGVAGTATLNQPSPGFNVGLQITIPFLLPASVQVGYGAFGRNGSLFGEFGGGTPGFSLTGFWVFDCQ